MKNGDPPPSSPAIEKASAISTATPDVILSLRKSGKVTYAVVINNRFAQGRRHDASGIFPIRGGEARIPVGVDLNAQPGTWTIEARDLTSGLRARLQPTVSADGATRE